MHIIFGHFFVPDYFGGGMTVFLIYLALDLEYGSGYFSKYFSLENT